MATRKPKSGAKKKPAAKASKPEKPECYGDAEKLDPSDLDCLECDTFEACSDAVSLSQVPEPESEPEPELEDETQAEPEPKPEPKPSAITTSDLPPKPGAPRRARPPVDPMSGVKPPEHGAVVMLLVGASDSLAGGQRFVRNKPVTIYDQRLIACLEGNPRYSVVTKK